MVTQNSNVARGGRPRKKSYAFHAVIAVIVLACICIIAVNVGKHKDADKPPAAGTTTVQTEGNGTQDANGAQPGENADQNQVAEQQQPPAKPLDINPDKWEGMAVKEAKAKGWRLLMTNKPDDDSGTVVCNFTPDGGRDEVTLSMTYYSKEKRVEWIAFDLGNKTADHRKSGNDLKTIPSAKDYD